tara:strand:- start:132 stop:617 length:486 start_codon:yes stop_codon:yes gene_type:complete
MGQPSIDGNYYNEKRFQGEWYEDYVYLKLEEKLKITIEGCNTQSKQYNIGENYFGWEIKYDDMYKKTGNLFIEYKEKTNKDNAEWVDSGIKRGDNSWLYLVGNERVLYFFTIKELGEALRSKDEYGNETYRRVPSGTNTSWGFLLGGQEEIDKYAIKTLIL